MVSGLLRDLIHMASHGGSPIEGPISIATPLIVNLEFFILARIIFTPKAPRLHPYPSCPLCHVMFVRIQNVYTLEIPKRIVPVSHVLHTPPESQLQCPSSTHTLLLFINRKPPGINLIASAAVQAHISNASLS